MMVAVHIMKTLLAGEWRAFGRDRSGAATLESTLLGALIAIVLIAGASEVSSQISLMFATVETEICNVVDSLKGGSGGGSGVGGSGGGGGQGGICGVGGSGSGGGGGVGGSGSGGGGSFKSGSLSGSSLSGAFQ